MESVLFMKVQGKAETTRDALPLLPDERRPYVAALMGQHPGVGSQAPIM